MSDEELLNETRRFLTNYLVSPQSGHRSIGNGCISVRSIWVHDAPPDAQAVRLLIEEPDQGWAVAAEAVYRSGKLWRLRFKSYHDDHDAHGGDLGIQRAYLDWLRSI